MNKRHISMLKKYQLKVKSFSVCYGNRFNIFLVWNSRFLFSSDIFLNICICFISCHTSNIRGGFRILPNIYGEASIGLTASIPPEKARKSKVFWLFQGVKTLNYFRRKALSYMFDRILNTPLNANQIFHL